MTTDWKALCAELVNSWTEGRDIVGPMHHARTALAQPEPEGPTESDLSELFYRYVGEGSEVGFENAIAEALARWGRPAVKLETNGQT